MELSPDTLLQLAPGIRTRRDAAGHVLVDSNVGTIIDIGPRGFAILSMFSQPIRLGDAIDRLRRDHDHAADLAPSLSVVNMLMEEGAIVTPDGSGAPMSGWADPVEHARMLHDERRTGDYLAAHRSRGTPRRRRARHRDRERGARGGRGASGCAARLCHRGQ